MPELLPSFPPPPPPLSEVDYTRGRRIFRQAFVFFLVVFCVGTAYWYGLETGREEEADGGFSEAPLSPDDAIIINKNAQDSTIDFSLFWKVWGLLKEKYVDRDELDARALFYGSIDGMLSATGDPYTTFFDPQENKEFQEDISGTFEGIGAEMTIQDGVVTVIAPLEGTPAEQAGLRAGDKVLKIDGESTTDLTLNEAVGRIRGAKGTSVVLTLFREGDEETREVTVKRDVILVKSVRFEMKEDGIAYLRLSRFGEETESEFKAAVREIERNKAQGLILDVRNNPGGFLETAVDLGGVLLPAGSVVVIEENGLGERKEMKTRGGDVLSGLPTAVLINEGSASASEILAGALRDNRDNVTLIGKKSFGKGSVQELVPVTKDTSVKITVARWLTPSGQQIHDEGITPDVEIHLTREDIEAKRDPQMEKALQFLKEHFSVVGKS